MGWLTSNFQQSSTVAHRATSNPHYKSSNRFVQDSKLSQKNSPRRGNLLGEMRPFWLKVKESEQRLMWLRTMVRQKLVVRNIEAYGKAISEQLRSEEMRFKEQERDVLLNIMKIKLRDENINLKKLQVNKELARQKIRRDMGRVKCLKIIAKLRREVNIR